MAERGIDRDHCAPALPLPSRAGKGYGWGDLRRYGLAQVTGLANVRDAISV